MNLALRTSHPRVDAAGAWLAAGLRRLARAYGAYAEARARAAAIRHLEALGDHTLRDIGLRRDQIPAAVRGGFAWW